MMHGNNSSTQSSRRSKRFRWLWTGLTLLVLIAALLPSVVARSSLRDRLINAMLAAPNLTASSASASLGWTTPLSIQGFQVVGREERFHVAVDQLMADRPWVSLLLASPEFGTISVEHPEVMLRFPLGEKGSISPLVMPEFKATIQNASLTIAHEQSATPIIDLDGLDATLQMHDTEKGHRLSVDAVDLYQHETLTREHCGELLELINPALVNAGALEGAFSLSLETFEVPVGVPQSEMMQQLVMKGHLALHQVVIETNNEVFQTLAKLVADTRKKPPVAQTRVIKDSRIDFEAREGRMHYQGLRFGFPDVAPDLEIHAHGSVGFDRSLDATFEVPRLDAAKQAERGPIVCRVTGSVEDPLFSAADASLVVHLPDRPEPLIDVDGIDLNARIERTADSRLIVFEPMDLLRQETINRQLAVGLLQLVDPELQFSPQIVGEVSLSMDTLRIPVGAPDEQWVSGLEAQGTLTIHDATSLVQSPLRLTLAKLLADLYSIHLQESLRMIQDAQIDFHLKQNEFRFQGLQFGFPEISNDLQVRVDGSIGLDQTLNLQVKLPRLDAEKRRQEGFIDCRITGTVRHPKFSVSGASLVVRLPGHQQPLLDVSDVAIDMVVEYEGETPILMVAPLTLFNRRQLTAQRSEEWLQLIAPALADVADLEGEFTLSIDALRIPLAGSTQQVLQSSEFKGRLSLHAVTANVETPLLTAMVKVLADQYGKTPSEFLQIAEDTEIQFEFRDGRLYQEGLQIGLTDLSDDLVCRASGSVGLDQSLDLILEVPASLAGSKEGGTKPLRFQVTGTIDSPQVVEIKNN